MITMSDIRQTTIDTGINSLALALFSLGAIKFESGLPMEGAISMCMGMSLEFFKYALRRWKRICEYSAPEKKSKALEDYTEVELGRIRRRMNT